MHGAPRTDAPLQGASHATRQFRVAPLQLLEHGDGAYPGRRLQERHDLGIEQVAQGIGSPPAARLAPLRGQPRVLLDAISRGPADGGLRRGDGGRMSLSECHVELHLVIGYVAAGQGGFSKCETAAMLGRPRTPVKALMGPMPWGGNCGRATPSLRCRPTTFSS